MISKVLSRARGGGGAPPSAGDEAPDFTATDADGATHTLAGELAHGPLVLVFFPKAFTAG
jgi:peroxiredoxin